MILYHGTTKSNASCIIRDGFIQGSKRYWLGAGVYFFTIENKAYCWMLPRTNRDSNKIAVIRLKVLDEDLEKYLLNLDDKSVFDNVIKQMHGLYQEAVKVKRRESIELLKLYQCIAVSTREAQGKEDLNEILQHYRRANAALGQIVNIIMQSYEDCYSNVKIIKKSFVNPDPKRDTCCFQMVEEIFCIRDIQICNLYEKSIC